MRFSKTPIALAVAFFAGMYGCSTSQAAWWDGDPQTSTVNVNGGSITITHDVNFNTDGQHALVLNGTEVDSDSVNIIINVAGSGSSPGRHGLIVDGANAKIDLSNAKSVTITDSLWTGHGLLVRNGGTIWLGENVTINQTSGHDQYQGGTNAHAVEVNSNGTVIFGNGNYISANAISSSALYVNGTGSSITIGDRNKLETYRAISHGIHADAGASITVGNGNEIVTYGGGSDGILIDSNGSLKLGNDNIITSYGDIYAHPTTPMQAKGIFVSGNNSKAEIGNGNKIVTHNEGAASLGISNTGNVQMGNNNTIISHGQDARSIYVQSLGELSLGNNNTIIAHGEDARSINALVGAIVSLGENNTIVSEGNGGRTVFANNANTTVTIGEGTVIQALGLDANAVVANDGAKVILEGRQNVYSAHGYAFIVGNGNGNIVADGQLTVSGNIAARSSTDTIALTFHDGSSLTGVSFAESGVANPNNYTGTVNMDMTGTRWNMTGDSYVTKLNATDSHIYFAQPTVPASRLYIAELSDKDSDSGAVFYMRSYVETGDIVNGGSGTNLTDKVIVTGVDEATGKHQVIVADRGGAKTSGTETITIIETEGGDHEFFMSDYNEQGYYLYGLRRTEADENNWELYGTGIIADTPKVVIDAIGVRYMLSLHEYQTLLQRLGDLRDSPEAYGAWVKLHGGGIKGKATTATVGYDLDYFGVQLGVDKKLQDEWLDGDVYLGLWGGYTKGELDYNSPHTGNLKDYFFGLYATYMDKTNTYADLVVKYGRQKNSVDGYSAQGTPVNGSDRINTYGASLEVGRRFHFERHELDEGFYVEPQAQLTLTHFGSGNMAMSSGLRVKNDSFDSLIGRLGVNVGIERKYGDTPYNAYVKISYLKELDGDVAVWFNNDEAQRVDFGDDWWTYGIGVTARLSDKHSVYMDIERSSASDMFKQSWRGNVGYRYNF